MPDPTLSLAEGALQPWTPRRHSHYWKRLIEAVAEAYGVDTDKPWAELDARRARDLPLRHRRRAPPDHLPQPLRPPPLLQRALRGDRQQPRAPLRGDRLGEHPRADRGLHGRAALPGLRRRPPAAGEPRRQGRRPQHRRVHAALGARAARGWIGDAGDDRDRAGDRPPDRARDRRAARLPRQRRHRLSLAGARGAHALRRRGAADPPRDPDRLAAWSASSTSSTSPRSACTSATTRS